MIKKIDLFIERELLHILCNYMDIWLNSDWFREELKKWLWPVDWYNLKECWGKEIGIDFVEQCVIENASTLLIKCWGNKYNDMITFLEEYDCEIYGMLILCAFHGKMIDELFMHVVCKYPQLMTVYPNSDYFDLDDDDCGGYVYGYGLYSGSGWLDVEMQMLISQKKECPYMYEEFESKFFVKDGKLNVDCDWSLLMKRKLTYGYANVKTHVVKNDKLEFDYRFGRKFLGFPLVVVKKFDDGSLGFSLTGEWVRGCIGGKGLSENDKLITGYGWGNSSCRYDLGAGFWFEFVGAMCGVCNGMNGEFLGVCNEKMLKYAKNHQHGTIVLEGMEKQMKIDVIHLQYEDTSEFDYYAKIFEKEKNVETMKRVVGAGGF